MKKKSENQNSLDFSGGGSINGDAPAHHAGESGSIPTPPLQYSPKQLVLRKISRATGQRMWVKTITYTAMFPVYHSN